MVFWLFWIRMPTSSMSVRPLLAMWVSYRSVFDIINPASRAYGYHLLDWLWMSLIKLFYSEAVYITLSSTDKLITVLSYQCIYDTVKMWFAINHTLLHVCTIISKMWLVRTLPTSLTPSLLLKFETASSHLFFFLPPCLRMSSSHSTGSSTSGLYQMWHILPHPPTRWDNHNMCICLSLCVCVRGRGREREREEGKEEEGERGGERER